MQRGKGFGLLGCVLAVAALAMVAEPAAAQDKKVRIAMQSAFGSTLKQLGSIGVDTTKKLEAVSGGTLDVKFHEPGALVPALQMFDAVSTGSLDASWSTPGYWTGKDVAFALFAAVPFGPPAGEYMGWLFYGGGKELQAELYSKYNIVSVPCAIIAPEASGWFRKEIKTVEDLKGLKMRFFGLGAKVMERLGVSTQLIAGGEIFQALQLGTIDATEFSMPAIDLDLGFYQVAKHYYLPGWHQQSTFFDMMISQNKWSELSKAQKSQIEMVCGDNFRQGLAEGEALQAKALNEIKGKGVTIHRWSPEILAAMEKAWQEVAAEEAAKNPFFKKVWDSYSSFREDYKAWAELGYLR